jgi:ribonuclease BN (tRNA processing enzyme)
MPSDSPQPALPVLELDTETILDALQPQQQRILLFGTVGIGKSSLATRLAETLATRQQSCWCLNADPGSPAFGIPGAVSLASWQDNNWQVSEYVAMCTLDAGRFRLPLLTAVQSLIARLPNDIVLIDTPGVVRSIAGRELLAAFVAIAGVDSVLALTVQDRSPPLLDELLALPVDVYQIYAAQKAQRPGKRVRARLRTEQWDAYLGNTVAQQIDLAKLNITGTPPPLEETHSWIGNQVALLRANHTVAMGEIQHLSNNNLIINVPHKVNNVDTLLIRDATRGADGLIETAKPFHAARFDYLPPGDVLPDVGNYTGPRIVGRVGAVDVGLINGVFGDPLLHLRVRQQRRSLLFDLGEGSRLPARIAHQVTDVFITHAHMDHIGGFLWLLRSRLGEFPVCRLYGPPGLAQHVRGFIQGVLWDRIADHGPRFEILELHENILKRFYLQAGHQQQITLDDITVTNGVVLQDVGFRISGVTLDHQGTPVIAYALQPDKQINVRKDRLHSRDLEPGPWLNALKQAVLSGHNETLIQLPNGIEETAGELADELTIITPGKKLVYATDFGDTPANRETLLALAHHAHTLFCEATFIEADADHAMRNGHLTTRACGEIASEAGVSRLVPFHFSRRYADNPRQLYDELKLYCPRVLIPKSMTLFEANTITNLESFIELNSNND